jgi:hypothetical protein
VRPAALFLLMASSAVFASLAEPASADCSSPGSPCVDAEQLWLSPSAKRLLLVSDARAPAAGQLELGLDFGFRYRPAVLTVPAPNENGRDINLVHLALDAALAARLGLGSRLELTLFAPAGLDQQGAGFKGVTSQSAPAIPAASLRDPRLGFGYSLPLPSRRFGAKIRFEAKLPLGSSEALAGERSVVMSPSFAAFTKLGGFFGGAELGARLRRPSELFGLRMGSQAVLAVGAGYELERPRLTFAAELYLLPSLIASGGVRYLPAEWLTSVRFTPRALPALSFGVGGGSGLPLSGDTGAASFAFGVPAFRALAFVRLSPDTN